jgi:hypothetical protein
MKNLFGLIAGRPYLVRESGRIGSHKVTVTRADVDSARLEFRDGSGWIDLSPKSDVSVEENAAWDLTPQPHTLPKEIIFFH